MFTLNLVTPEKKLVTGMEIEEVFVPAHRGELNILPGHSPLMTTLVPGALRYRLKGEQKLRYVSISWGYCQVNPQGVKVLAETAELPEEIDLDRADAALKGAQQHILVDTLTEESLSKYQNKILRAFARKEVASHRNDA